MTEPYQVELARWDPYCRAWSIDAHFRLFRCGDIAAAALSDDGTLVRLIDQRSSGELRVQYYYRSQRATEAFAAEFTKPKEPGNVAD